jgi:hypothetical protein
VNRSYRERQYPKGMPMTTMNQLFDSTMFFGGNAPFVEELYENYLE